MIRKSLLAVLALSTLVTGCAGLSNIGKTPEEIIATRADARWKAIIAGDWKSAYQYTTPAYRETITQAHYQGYIGSAVIRKAVEVKGVKCEEATACDATLHMTYTPVMMRRIGDITTVVTERWVDIDGEWYIYHNR
jgi:hypothetical protein